MSIAAAQRSSLVERFLEVRSQTESLAAPLSAEDQTVQSMPDCSPTKWHRAHTTWFFEEFVLSTFLREYVRHDERFRYLFNSYYDTVGVRQPRPKRGLITRPSMFEIEGYRRAVDDAVLDALDQGLESDAGAAAMIELGLQHEQQHQELLLMDIKHLFAEHPFAPAYLPLQSAAPITPAPPTGWTVHSGGVVPVGAAASAFSFDNERPRHEQFLAPFAIANSLVTNQEWLAFIDDGGYRRSELWLSDGWHMVNDLQWRAPLYWREVENEWCQFTLHGLRPIRDSDPVVHVSYFEADAFARWSGARLPSEGEWETLAAHQAASDRRDAIRLEPNDHEFFGSVWQWTSSSYAAYPGFRPAAGAVGEYNGKFMVNQYVLRGSACVTPIGHSRLTYRNFFPAHARWAYSGCRLARDA